MTKTIKLFFDFEFTSLSPDAQPISLGIVSDCGKSFYSEFSDFDINRCDDWVKENVVRKLLWRDSFPEHNPNFVDEWEMVLNTKEISESLKEWLKLFSDYQIQFVCDCGTYDWYWMVQLLAEWDSKFWCEFGYSKETAKCKGCDNFDCNSTAGFKNGLPKLPTNISPVPEDLNDLIARNKGISVREAFDLNRERMASDKGVWLIPETAIPDNMTKKEMMEEIKKTGDIIFKKVEGFDPVYIAANSQKHNALWDAKVIKEIYQKLK